MSGLYSSKGLLCSEFDCEETCGGVVACNRCMMVENASSELIDFGFCCWTCQTY